MTVTSGRHREWILALAVVLVMLGAVTSRAVAVAPSLRKLVAGTVAFSSDGTRFVAWQTLGDQQIEVLDTLTGLRKQITPPDGCVLHDEAEDGEPIVSAAAGRFLLDGCGKEYGQALFDIRTGKAVSLPGSNSTWYRVGTRYVMGVDVLYNIATGVSTRLHRPADLDARGASMKTLCPAVRHLVSRYQPKGFFASFAYQGDLFAQGYGTRGDVQIDRCHGRPTILRARGNDHGFVGGKPEYFDLRGGLLSWDTGSDATAYIERPFRGSIYAYELTSHRLRRWPLPRVTIREGYEPRTGTFGYSTHTANMVFWIASQTLSCDKLCDVEKSAVYAASLK